jgi:DNA modification methylase
VTVDDLTYVTDDAEGDGWQLMLGDACERLAELPDDSVDLSVCSPPFAQLYAYSPSPRDLSNSGSREEFFNHYSYVIRHQLRVTKPGRLACVHVQQITRQKILHGYIGLTDFRGEVIRAFEQDGWIFWGEVTIDKDPQAQAIRTKASTLLFVTKERDASQLRPALADYLLLFKKPGDNATPVRGDVTNEEWIAWARPVWLDIRETNTLNTGIAKDDADERHICPLQLDFIERCIRLFSNRDETVLSPFAGIGSEGYVAVQQHRRFIGVELKPSYYATAVRNLREAVVLRDRPRLDLDEVPA